MSRIGLHREPGQFGGPDEEFHQRVRACRIHQWTDVGEYMERCGIPPQYRRHFQELILVRSRYPKVYRPGQQEEYMERVCEIVEGFRVPGFVRGNLLNILASLVMYWEASEPSVPLE
jgi:hypothetical protein